MSFISQLKLNYPNFNILIVAILVAIWLRGMYGLLDVLFPTPSITLYLGFILFSLGIFYLDDGQILELERGRKLFESI